MLTYEESGVSLEKSEKIVKSIKALWPGIGLFGGQFEIGPHIKGMKNPVLISSTDGVGTKTRLASRLNDYTVIGYDIVNHCINDIIVHGAKPLFFLDYIASSNLNPEMIDMIILSMTMACKENDLQIIGGEIAELPGVYKEKEFDIVGTIVGVVDKENLIDGSKIEEGDAIIGLASHGVHTNGFSLLNKILEENILDKDFNPQICPYSLYDIHKSYYEEYSILKKKNIDIKGMAHITGGGIKENLSRIIPDDLVAIIEKKSWPTKLIFEKIQQAGVDEKEMYKVFNMGLGMILIIKEENVKSLNKNLKNSFLIGTIKKKTKEKEKVILF